VATPKTYCGHITRIRSHLATSGETYCALIVGPAGSDSWSARRL
jgi:hypothetical protein